MIPKFRFYHLEENKMYEVNGIRLSQKTVECFPKDNRFSFITFEEDEGILMQSTGLFDKNGVEIFEGDTIDKGYHNLSIENRIGYVEFNQGGDSDGWAHGDWLGWITNNHDSLLDVHALCTVLGNKYEHPHLLKE